MAIVYLLSNPAFENYVKIGRTKNLEARLKQLDNTSVPLPFRCEFAVEVSDSETAEQLLHRAFADHRVRSSREFFEISPHRVIAAMMLTGGRDVTPKVDVAEDQESLLALDKQVSKTNGFYFLKAAVSVGDTLTFTRNERETATVVSKNRIEFRGEVTSLSAAALTLLREAGYEWKAAQGTIFWMKDGETIDERMKRIAYEDAAAIDSTDGGGVGWQDDVPVGHVVS